MKSRKTSDDDKDKTREKPGAMKIKCASTKNAATVVGEVISISVAPLRLQPYNSQKEVRTFALLDSCKQGTFVTERILK